MSADSIEGEKRELVYIVSIILGFRSNDKITKILSCLVTKFLTYHLINFVMKLLYPQNCTMILKKISYKLFPNINSLVIVFVFIFE